MRARKIDANQRDIVDAFRKHGCSVWHTHMVGGGFPDIVVGYRRRNHLVEIKGPKGKLNSLQESWIKSWAGKVHVVRSIADVVNLVRGAFSDE